MPNMVIDQLSKQSALMAMWSRCITQFLIVFSLVLAWLSTPALAQLSAQFMPGGEQAQEEEVSNDRIEQLVEILEDDAARERLIETLRAATEEEEAARPAPTLARQLAERSQDFTDALLSVVSGATGILGNIGEIFTTHLPRFVPVAIDVGIVMAAALGTLFVIRFVANRAFGSLAASAEGASILRRFGLLVASFAVDALAIAVAWGAGWLMTLYLGESGRMGINQSLFLNAFALIELVKVVLRALLAPVHMSLRIAPITDTSAVYWYFWLSRLVSVIGYTFLFIAPILSANVSRASADAVRIVVTLAALVMTCLIIMQNRDPVRAALVGRAAANDHDVVGQLLRRLASVWHMIAIVYLVAIFVLWLVNPRNALPFVIQATFQSLVGIAIGLALLVFLRRMTSAGMRLPEEMKESLPMLEARLNAFVPTIMRVVRIVVVAAVIVTIAQAWQLADVAGWLSSELGQRMATSLISAAIILALGGLAYLAVASWVEYRLNPNVGVVPSARERTLLALFRNAFTVILALIVLMLVLAELGVNIGPLLAGAGVAGLAIGFGAQKLVQDVINGGFIQFENAMNEGDFVTAGNISGTVEKLTIRSVSLRSLDGAYHVVPFSAVDALTNYNKNFAFHMAETRVALHENIPKVKQAMSDAFDELRDTEHNDNIIGDLEMNGITQFLESGLVVRARIKTVAGEQWAVGRAYNEIVKRVFEERGIEIPFPHRTIHVREDGAVTPALPRQGGPEASSSQAQANPKRRKRRKRKPAQDGPAGTGHEATSADAAEPD